MSTGVTDARFVTCMQYLSAPCPPSTSLARTSGKGRSCALPVMPSVNVSYIACDAVVCQVHLAMRRFVAATKDAEAAIAIDPSCAKAWYRKGRALEVYGFGFRV